MLRENKEHRVRGLKDFQDKDFEDVLKRPAFCPKELHEKAVFKFYCKVCEVPACQTCVTLKHSKHDVEHLKITARAVKKNIDTKLDTPRKSCQTISNCIRELEEQCRLTENRAQIDKGQIQQSVRSLILTLQQKERELITEVENQTKEALDNFTKDKANLQDQLKKGEESIAQVERFVERSTGAELVRTKTFVNELFQEHHEPQDTAMLSTRERKYPITGFLKTMQQISEILQEAKLFRLEQTKADQCSAEGFQEATAGLVTQFEVITRNYEGEQFYCPGDYIVAEIISAQSGKAAVEMAIVDKHDGSYEISFIPCEAGQHIITVQLNGEKIREIPPINIKERSFMPVRFIGEGSIDNKHLKSPWGVAVNDSNEIVVSDMGNNRILVLNEKGEFIRSFGQNLVDKPTGVTIDNQGRIFVACRGNNKILLFNPNGEFLRTVINDGSLNQPRGISLDSQGNLIVCDSGNKRVKLISPDGKILKTTGVGWLHFPLDCLCYEDKIFVSDRLAHVIKVYNNMECFLYKFGKYGTGDELKHPTGLLVDKTGHLLVCSEGNHRVQIFTLSGKFVSKFGERGDELGQLMKPTSLCVLKSGRIVVCEFGNGRLQIFA